MLVKWWLLALPHYLVVGVFIGAAWVATDRDWMLGSGGLVGLLVLFAGVALLFTGRYPKAPAGARSSSAISSTAARGSSTASGW